MSGGTVRSKLELALRDAMKARDSTAVSALRSALAAIDNAGAVPIGTAPVSATSSPHFAGSAPGIGAGEAMRSAVSEAEVERIVRAEHADRLAAAQDYERAGHSAHSARLHREAAVLAAVLPLS